VKKELKKFIVKGEFKAGIKWEKFTKVVESYSERSAVEKVFSTIGSNHKLKRYMIRILEVKEA